MCVWLKYSNNLLSATQSDQLVPNLMWTKYCMAITSVKLTSVQNLIYISEVFNASNAIIWYDMMSGLVDIIIDVKVIK